MRNNLRIKASHYHAFHIMPALVAKEMMFFEQEGLEKYEVLTGGLIPAVAEKIALPRAMKEEGIDVLVDAKPIPVFLGNERGEDICIIACWRNQAPYQVFAKKGITSVAQLKGKRIAIRDYDDIFHTFFRVYLKRFGIDPIKDVTWVRGVHNVQAYRALVDDLADSAHCNFNDNKPLLADGYPMLLDMRSEFPQGRPDRIIAATKSVVEEHPAVVKSFLKGMIRAFWFMRNVKNYEYGCALERRLRWYSWDEEERVLPPTFTSPQKMESYVFPIDGIPSVKGLEAMVVEAQEMGELDDSFDLQKALKLDLVRDAFKELAERPELQGELERMRQLVTKYSY